MASPHRIATFSSCSCPTTLKGLLRSFFSAYKYLAGVIQNCFSFVSLLEDLVAGKPSHKSINWYDSSAEVFIIAQKLLYNHKSITIPKPEGQLWLVTDGAVKKPGFGSTLYVLRNEKLYFAGYFSEKFATRCIPTRTIFSSH